MQKDKIVKKSATLKLRGVDTVLYGTIMEQDDNGFWLVLNKDTLTKIVGMGALPHGGSQAEVFIPFSSISWLVASSVA